MSTNRRPPRMIPDLALLHREVSLLFDRLAEFERTEQPRAEPGGWSPPVDVYECHGKLVVLVEVPGLAPESLKAVVRDRQLVITGERRERRPPQSLCGFLCMERPRGRFSRSMPLDVAVDVRGAVARLSRGVLTIELPRVEDRRGAATPIPIQREDDE